MTLCFQNQITSFRYKIYYLGVTFQNTTLRSYVTLLKGYIDTLTLKVVLYKVAQTQCDQKKIAKCLKKLPKNDFTRKIKYFDTFTKIA